MHNANLKTQTQSNEINSSPRKHSPCRRTQSEDVYNERCNSPVKSNTVENVRTNNSSSANSGENTTKRQIRVNPLMRLAENKQDTQQKSSKSSARRKSQQSKSEMLNKVDNNVVGIKSETIIKQTTANDDKVINSSCKKKSEKTNVEKRVSFDCNIGNKSSDKTTNICHTPSLIDESTKVSTTLISRALPDDERRDSADEIETSTSTEVHFAKEETTPVELCDIEPLSGTVFRKVTVRRRRQDMRKVPAVDTGE